MGKSTLHISYKIEFDAMTAKKEGYEDIRMLAEPSAEDPLRFKLTVETKSSTGEWERTSTSYVMKTADVKRVTEIIPTLES